MLQIATQRYRQVAQSTFTPGELLLALYAGLFRYLRTARRCLVEGRTASARELISKAHAIVAELDLALDHEVAPELCHNLSNVYGFCFDRLHRAARHASSEAIDEVLRVLTPLQEAWLEAVPAAVREQGRADAPRAKAR